MYEEYAKHDVFTLEDYPQSIHHSRPSAEMKVIPGTGIKRVDAGPKVTGQAKYANDMFMANPLYLKFKRCPYSHAKVRSVDTSKAKALPGVVTVLTHDDIPDMMARPPYHWVLMEEALHEGTEVAAVAADEEDIAEEAVTLIDVDYEVLPFVIGWEEAAKSGAPVLWGDSNLVGTPWEHTRGDVDAGFADADTVVEGRFTTWAKPHSGNVAHAPVMNEAWTASWENGIMHIWTDTQGPHGDTRTAASTLGLPYNQVVALPTYSGVGYGGKGSNSKGKMLAVWISRETNRPVKWRQDSEGYFNTARSQWTNQDHSFKVGVKNDGTLTAISDISNNESGSWGGRASSDSHRVVQAMFETTNLYLKGSDWATNAQGVGTPRCVAHPSSSATVGPMMDSVAEKLGMNPGAFLVKNVNKRHDVDDLDFDWDVGTNPMPDMLEKLIDDSSFNSKWKGWGTPMSESGSKKRGIGLGIHVCRHGYLSNPMSAMVKANRDGTFQINVGSYDNGTGARTALAIMAAEELGVPAEAVTMSMYRTDTTQESVGTGGSRVTRGSGTAVIVACRDAKQQLFKIAIDAGLIEAGAPEDLESETGNIYLKADKATTITVKSATAKQNTVNGPIIGRGAYATKRDRWMHRQWGACAAEVEVDTDTGEVTVTDAWVWHDVGRVIWTTGCVNQIYGGTTMAIGRAITEGLVKDEGTGITLNPNYTEYKIMTHMDIPDMHINPYESIDHYAPFGARGIGEPICATPQPAVANAIYNAIGGTRITSTMVTPDKVLAAIGKA